MDGDLADESLITTGWTGGSGAHSLSQAGLTGISLGPGDSLEGRGSE